MWKRLEHQNIVPLLGITSYPLQLISEWMSGGDLTEYIRKHPEADRLGLVVIPPVVFDPTLTPATSCLTLLRAFAFSTPATLFMVISREYVIEPSPVLPLHSHVSSRISLWTTLAAHGSRILALPRSLKTWIRCEAPRRNRVIPHDGLHQRSYSRRGRTARKRTCSPLRWS